MKKLKLKNLSKAGNVLTSEELKHVYGGAVLENNDYGSGYRCVCVYTYYHPSLGSECDWSVIIPDVFDPRTCEDRCQTLCIENHYSNCESIFTDIYS